MPLARANFSSPIQCSLAMSYDGVRRHLKIEMQQGNNEVTNEVRRSEVPMGSEKIEVFEHGKCFKFSFGPI